MISPREPATPKKPPPFQKRLVGNGNPPPSPSSNYTEADLILPAGNELILRSVYDRTRGISDPIPLVNAAIEELMRSHESLKEVPVIVKPFSNRANAPPTTVCYVRLHPNFDVTQMQEAEGEPRCDLLDLWRRALESARPQWDVQWQPQKSGSDKRLWLRFPDLSPSGSGSPPEESISKVRSHLQSKGYVVTNHFTNTGGSVLVLADHSHVDKVLAEGTLLVPTVSRQALRVYHGRQIEVLEAFELVILGISEYDGISLHLADWLTNNFTESGNTCFVNSRIPDSEPDAFVFHMCDWKSTVMVLRAKDDFISRFADIKSLTPPQLLWRLNGKGIWKRDIRSDFKQGARDVQDGLTALSRKFDKLERDVKSQAEVVQRQLHTLTSNVTELSSNVGLIGSQLANNQRALLLAGQQGALRSRLANIQLQITSERARYRSPLNETDRLEAKAELEALAVIEKELLTKIQQMDSGVYSLIAGPNTIAEPPRTTPSSQSGPLTSPKTGHTLNTSRKQGNADRPQSGSSPKRARRAEVDPLTQSAFVPSSIPIADDVQMEAYPVSSLPSRYMHMLMETRVDPTVVSMMHSSSRSKRPFCNGFVGIFNQLKDLPRSHTGPILPNTNNTLFVASPPSKSSSSFSFKLTLLFLILLSCFTLAATAQPNIAPPFSVYALNGNGLTHAVKMNHIKSVIQTRRPHIFVLSESKTNSRVSSSLPYSDYSIFEEPGVRSAEGHPYKWGLIVGVRKDIQVAQRVSVSQQSLKGRVIALDIVLTTNLGKGFIHRIIGAYAPWNPGIDQISQLFWEDLTNLCTSTSSPWTLAGDLNATISQSEKASGGTEARNLFTHFLQATNAHDLWSDYPERSRMVDWTSRGRDNPEGGSIIDRVVSSSTTLVDSEIEVTRRSDDFVPYTDHRAVIARIRHSPPDSLLGSHVASSPNNHFRPQPRIKYPNNTEKHKFQDFRVKVDTDVANERLHETPVIDDASFLHRYMALTRIITNAAEIIFGRAKRSQAKSSKITSPRIQKITSAIRHLGGAIRLAKDPASSRAVSHTAHQLFQHHLRVFREMDGDHDLTFLQYLIKVRRQCHKDLFAERASETWSRAKRDDRLKISNALRGGTTRHLVNKAEYVPLPSSINDPTNPEDIISDPQQVKEKTRYYFSKLYARNPPPDIPKPWMTTPTITQVKERVQREPFLWPRPANLNDFRAMLRRGNPRPSPGPDGWEKWCIKSLSDNTLSLVLDLHNYEVMNSRFPGDIKDTWITMFHKRGLRTDLTNWRGLFLSNFLANSPMTWLTQSLTPYAARMGIIPETQVATQPGVQTRDLMSFLSGLKCWSTRRKQTVYAIKRDQMKGFDYLAPEGFYDAIEAYGLPSSIVALDRAAQANNSCHIRTAHGITEPIVVTGVTKQGGPLSPLKSTLTTGLGHRYLTDLASRDPDALIITSASALKGDPHLPDDHLQLTIAMAEATDDSYIFSKSINSLRTMTLEMERFQFAYGWLTQWLKTVAFVLNCNDTVPEKISFPSISTGNNQNPMDITEHEVPLIQDELEFLRTKVDDPRKRYEELVDIIQSFTFPRIVGHYPITLVRKIIAQNIVSRCRALLSLQPIKHKDAQHLDTLILSRAHEFSRLPFKPSTTIATLPVSMWGSNFPSIARINTGIAIDGIARDLNHHVKSYRIMAKITLADWTCEKNGCIYPLDGRGLHTPASNLTRGIPSAWMIAQQAMSSMAPKLALRQTDISHITSGEVSLSHIFSIHNSLHQQVERSSAPDGHALRSLRGKGIRMLKDIGCWNVENQMGDNPEKVYFQTQHQPRSLHSGPVWSAATERNYDKVVNALTKLNISDLFSGDSELLLKRDERRTRAEETIKFLALSAPFSPSSNCNKQANQIWATDGSMQPAAAGIGDNRTVTTAVTGPQTTVMKLTGRSSSILHGELMGILSGIVLANDSNHPTTPLLYTDHLNSVRLIEDIRTLVDQEPRLRRMNGRSYYRWILSLINRKSVSIHYTKGHSDEMSLQSLLNSEADYYATKGQIIQNALPVAPTPTFFMDEYTFYRPLEGWIESNIRSYIEVTEAKHTASQISIGHDNRMSTWLYDPIPPPEYPYTKALSAHSALIQLYARSGQLATADNLFKRGLITSNSCRFGCEAIEDMYHLFTTCERYQEWRLEAENRMVTAAETRIASLQNVESGTLQVLTQTAKSIISDDDAWPTFQSCYYLGYIPPFQHLLPKSINELTRRRLCHSLANQWHIESIRLTSRIYGDVQREMARRKDS